VVAQAQRPFGGVVPPVLEPTGEPQHGASSLDSPPPRVEIVDDALELDF
jgi:hypothetical protein